MRGEIADSLSDGHVPRLSELAERMALSERSLRRQLAAHTLSFRKLLDDQRRERARTLLPRYFRLNVPISRCGTDDSDAFGGAIGRLSRVATRDGAAWALRPLRAQPDRRASLGASEAALTRG